MLRSVAVTVVLIAVLGSAGVASATVVGIADPRPAALTDPRLGSLGLREARLVVSWDAVLEHPGPVDEWLAAARAAGLDPLVTFAASSGDRCPHSPCVAPSPGAYRTAFRAFRDRYPWVTTFAPWNEANHETQPLLDDPERAAEYYEVLRGECPECRILAADVVDIPNMRSWLTRFLQAADGSPRLWGLHNYGDVNWFGSDATDVMLRTVPGEVWLTETGGIVSFVRRNGEVALPYDEQRAALATHHLFALARARRDRLTRIYIYSWKHWGPNRWDSGLIGPSDVPRPAFWALAQELQASRLRAEGGGRRPGWGRLRLVSRHPRRGRRRSFRLALGCVGGRGTACSGSVAVRKVARVHVRMRAGTRVTKRFRLRRAQARRLARKGRLPLRVTVRCAGHRSTSARVLLSRR